MSQTTVVLPKYHGRVTTSPGQGRVARLYNPVIDLDLTLYSITPDFRFRLNTRTTDESPRAPDREE
ncbi:hypothetical protein T265_05060 [Opisthorchis viverrini]|uniref:Uncharacterized protein n=1 Tax=Opisthorchis viverrini TaxID=6198 RepID=A0A075AFQ9_OPIVI|nr:hypothetical protein T265_05060 [Opisthorchis viverrini]KER28014.1 hypothetical protein T265_05060 [Opisthorchis viverrini]